MSTSAQTSVFVSGATGFIAQHLCQQLLQKGYKVVGSVRSAAKGDALKKNLASDDFSYEIVKDLAEEGCFDEALKAHPEVTIFLHTASPFTFTIENPERDLLIPAVKGTTNALNAIKAYAPQIKRVVLTSSIVAICDFSNGIKPQTHFDESVWNPVTWEQAQTNGIAGYCGSKTFAEKAAWEFLKNEKPNFTLSTINPSYVWGPQLFDEDAKKAALNTSSEVLSNIFKLKPDSDIPDITGSFVDVRDVALSHILAFEKDEAQGKRFITSEDSFSTLTILKVMRNEFPSIKDRWPVPKEETRDIADFVGTLDNTASKEVLGLKYTSVEKCVADSVSQLLRVE
ncbi:hypothetical protein CANARDRAFT_201320 [[Candida] arabinofermentans NRRL YB-2248]|uniref:3-beta hydroxysteroid dehydrogenase/isomerase domain-containing protein n=1 Tax=[Candida] arabinofermentans NRRL YB-2248 TaxID=983967 RepID=A0A1E4SXC5_9ASCO|nr:hypothetical protein CANARDRAFT_201320 [[Candida] arabinofermentans NRRL YB-2248]